MWKVLASVKTHLVWVLPGAMIAGLILGAFVDVVWMKSLILPLTIIMIFPMMMNLQWRSLVSGGGKALFFTTAAVNFLLIPFLAFFMAKLFFPGDVSVLTGMVLIGVLPTSGMTISWTGFAKGHIPGAVRNVLAGLIIGALVLPLFLILFIGRDAGISPNRIFGQLGFIIAVPMVLGALIGSLTRRRLGPEGYARIVKPKAPLISSSAVVVMVFVAMALKARSILSAPEGIPRALALVLVFYAAVFSLAHVVSRFLPDDKDGIALVFSTAVRNLSIALALSFSMLGKDSGTAALISSLAFLVQVQVAAWYVKIIERRKNPSLSSAGSVA